LTALLLFLVADQKMAFSALTPLICLAELLLSLAVVWLVRTLWNK
jgi:hypothetical protein